MITRAYTDGLERALGRVVADMQRQFGVYVAQSDAVIAQLQARAAEAETRFAALEKATAERLAEQERAAAERMAAHIAERADPADVAQTVKALIEAAVSEAVSAVPAPVVPDVAPMVAEAVKAAVAALPEPQPGKGADPAEIEALRREIDAVREAIPALPEAPDMSGFATKADLAAIVIPGMPEPKDWTPEIEAVRAAIPAPFEMPDLSHLATKADIPAIPEPKDWTGEIAEVRALAAEAVERVARHPGRFPIAKHYAEGVHYAGDVVTHKGATWQALRDTGREPGHEDWSCLSARGEPGEPGRSFVSRGTFDPAEVYAAMDVVARNGSGWVAKHDNPGDCPGDGWQLIASKGGKGDAIKGDKGDPAAPVVAAEVTDDGVLRLTHGDGSTVEADFYPVLSRLAK